MAVHTKPNKGDVLAGVVGIRAPDGSIAKTVKFYREAPGGAAKAGKLTKEEEAVCDGIVRDMAVMYHDYVQEVAAMERQKSGK